MPLSSRLSSIFQERYDTSYWVIIGLVTVFVFPRLVKYAQRVRSMPPGPRGLPLLGNALQVPKSLPWFQFTQWSKEYGPIFSLNLAGQPAIVLNTFQDANELLERRSNIYSDRPTFIVADEFLTGGASLAFTSYGPIVRKLRRAAHVGFNQRAITRYQPIQKMEAIHTTIGILNSPDSWEKQLKRLSTSSTLGSIYDWDIITDEDTPLLKRIFAVANMLTNSATPGAFLVEIIPALKYLPSWMAKWKRDAIKWHEEQTGMFDGFNRDVRRRKTSGDLKPCFIADLIENEEQLKLSKRESAWLPGMLFTAGAETTSAAMIYFFLAMVLYPETMRKAHQELDEVIGREHPPNSHDIEKLPYIQAIMKEVLRWRPPGPMGIPHKTTQDDWYRGHLIPKGSLIIANIWEINRNLYMDPEEFKPERHLEGVLVEGTNPAGHSTFGFGRRICPGMYYAMHTLSITIATLLWASTWAPELDANGNAVLPSSDEFVDHGITVGAKPFKCKVLPRFPEAREILERELKCI